MTTLDRYAHWTLVAIVCLVPLPFASVETWTWSIAAILTALLLLCWSIGRLFTVPTVTTVPLGSILVPAVLFGLVIIWIFVQASSLTPESWHHPIWREASRSLGGKVAGSVSLDPQASIEGLIRLLWYAVVFGIAVLLCRDRTAARYSLVAVAGAGFLYAVYGLVIEFSGAQMVLWVDKTAYLGSLTSTFINRNAYAAYAGIGLICMTALLIRRLLKHEPSDEEIVVSKMAMVLSYFGYNWYLVLGWLVSATALILTNSRAGVLSSFIGVFVFIIAMGYSRGAPSRLLRYVALALVIGCMIAVSISGATLGRRLIPTEISDTRSEIYRLTMTAIGDAPVLGMGHGAYPKIFEVYREDVKAFDKPARKAHNTYLENAVELGIPAAAVLFSVVIWLVGVCMTGLRRRRRDSHYAAIGLGVTALLTVHALVDFSLQIPAVAVTYMFLLGLAVAQSWGTRENTRDNRMR